MTTQDSYRVTFIGDDVFIEELKSFAAKNPVDVNIESELREKDATRLGFDLVTAAAIVTIISGALYTGELAVKLFMALRKSKSNKIIIQSPFKTLELQKSGELTEEDVRKFLEAAQVID